jgi:PAS domain S-box-containing protein
MNKIFKHIVNKSFIIKVLLPTLLTIGLFFLSIFQIIIPRFEEIIIDRKREMIRELTNSAWSVADKYYNEELDGLKAKTDAQKAAIELIQHLRYGEDQKDYFWITDLQPRMIIHPYRQDLNGKDLSDFKDSQGKKLFVEIVSTVNEKGEGYVDYNWQWKDDSIRIVPKLSYVKKFEPWGWIIGTGIYIEDVKLEIADLEKNVINISIGITIIISLLLSFIAIQNIKSEKHRLQAENELKESKEKYKALVGATTEGLIMILDGGQIYYNKTILAMLGYTEAESSGLNLSEIFTRDLKLDDIESLKIFINSHIETQLKRKDGELLETLLTASPISFLGNQGIVVVAKDISRHKQIENALDESEEKYASLTNQLTIGVFRIMAGKEMKFLEINPAAVNIFGCRDNEELLNTSIVDFFEDVEDRKIFLKELSDVGFIKNKMMRLRRKDNVLAVVSVSVVAVKDESGNTRYYDGIVEDITANKQTEEDTESMISELRASLYSLDQPIKPFIKECLTCEMDAPLSKAAKLMSKNKTEIILIQAEPNKFVGTLTTDDLRERVFEAEFNSLKPVYEIMKSPFVSIQDSSSIFDAMSLFFQSNLKHLVVRNGSGKVCGTVSIDDIMKAHHLSYLFFVQRIEKSESVRELSMYRSKLLVFIKAVIDSGSNAQNITRMATIISDTIAKKILSLTIEDIGIPPVKFVFMAMGSEGREEQTLATDQDNAIVYEDVPVEMVEEVRAYFSKLSERVCDGLNTAGYSFCKGGVMAKNPKWCQPLSVWKKYFSDWVSTANPQDLLDINIFFDFKSVYGDESLTEDLQNHLHNIISGNNAFFVYLTQNALRIKPPIGQFKSSEVFDIKLALLPIVDLARIYALRNKVKSNNTLERLNRLYEKNVFSKSGYQDIIQAYSYLMQLRFAHQAKLLSDNIPPDNNINPKYLTELEKTIVRRILTQIEDFQTKLSLDFKGTL